MAARTYRCFACGHLSASVAEDMAHVTNCPEQGKSTITRPVACWSCAGEVDLREGRTCPTCGAEYAYEPSSARPSARAMLLGGGVEQSGSSLGS